MQDLRLETDSSLLLSLKSGGEAVFAEIYARYWPQLFLHAQRMLDDEEEARDVVQEVFMVFWDKFDRLPEIRHLKAYLYRMVRNRVLDLLADRRQQDEAMGSISDFIVTESPPADAAIHEAELIELIDDEIASMPEKMRLVYQLSRIENLSHKEIAAKLDVTNFNVKTQLNNAIRRIKRRIGYAFTLFM